MADDTWMLWSHDRRRWRSARRRRTCTAPALPPDGHTLTCWLLYHGEFGVEARWNRDGELFYSRVFISKALAVAWAEAELADARAEGWQDISGQTA